MRYIKNDNAFINRSIPYQPQPAKISFQEGYPSNLYKQKCSFCGKNRRKCKSGELFAYEKLIAGDSLTA